SGASGGRACLTGWLRSTPIIVMTDKGGRMQLPLDKLEGQISTTPILSYDVARKSLRPKSAVRVDYGTSSEAWRVTFSADGKNAQSYIALPDALVYLVRTETRIGKDGDKVHLGYWRPVRTLWPGAEVRGM